MACKDSEVQVIDGYFVHFFVPENLETLPKHAIFILDVSGSMYGERLQQLKDAMFTVLDDMKPEDFFNIITFSTGVNNWSPSGVTNEGDQLAIPATKENKKKAISHVLDLEAEGLIVIVNNDRQAAAKKGQPFMSARER